jgi:hypothetical protein
LPHSQLQVEEQARGNCRVPALLLVAMIYYATTL